MSLERQAWVQRARATFEVSFWRGKTECFICLLALASLPFYFIISLLFLLF